MGKSVLEIVGEYIGKPFEVREEVVENDGEFVVLEVVVDKPGDVRTFRIKLKDTWKNRSTWLLTRPAVAYWKKSGSKLVEGKPGDAVKDWLPAFMPYQVSGANLDLGFEELTVAGNKSLCSRLSLDATANDKPAKLTMWDCAGNLWRMTRLEVTDAESGEVLWGFRQK